jgi:predicted permease
MPQGLSLKALYENRKIVKSIYCQKQLTFEQHYFVELIKMKFQNLKFSFKNLEILLRKSQNLVFFTKN